MGLLGSRVAAEVAEDTGDGHRDHQQHNHDCDHRRLHGSSTWQQIHEGPVSGRPPVRSKVLLPRPSPGSSRLLAPGFPRRGPWDKGCSFYKMQRPVQNDKSPGFPDYSGWEKGGPQDFVQKELCQSDPLVTWKTWSSLSPPSGSRRRGDSRTLELVLESTASGPRAQTEREVGRRAGPLWVRKEAGGGYLSDLLYCAGVGESLCNKTESTLREQPLQASVPWSC